MKINYKFFNSKPIESRIKKHETSVKFMLILSAGEAKAVAPLSPIFGQFGISCQDFCKKFNEESLNIINGTPLRVSLYLLTNTREFKFKINAISFIKIISVFYTNSIKIYDLYKIYICFYFMYACNFKNTENIQLKLLKALRGIIKTMCLKVLVFSKFKK